jgi:uncharacterized protein YecT (DUF1311 family)
MGGSKKAKQGDAEKIVANTRHFKMKQPFLHEHLVMLAKLPAKRNNPAPHPFLNALKKGAAMKTSKTIASAALLLLLGVSAPQTSRAASFDCSKSDLKADEKTICDNRNLNDLDVKMVTTFELMAGLLPMGNRGELQDQQSAWLKTRQACNADATCIGNAYEARLKQLMAAYSSIQKPQ